MQVEERGRSEPRLTVPTICLGFIADSLFSATLIGLCRTKGPLSGLPRMTRREKVVARMPQSSFRKEVVIALQNIGYQDRTSLERSRGPSKSC